MTAPDPYDTFHENVDDFIQNVFGQEWPNAWVTGFAHDPAASSADGKVQAIAWGGAPYQTARNRIRPEHNNYLCISTFARGEDGRRRRRTALHAATFALMIDDVGEKVPLDRVKIQPTFKIQTSPGSQQWWYVLAEPEADGRKVKAVIDNLINAGLMTDNRDPGMRGVNRYGRLPFGVNTKAKYKRRDGSYPGVALVEPAVWSNKPTLEGFCAAFGISSEAHALVELGRAPIPADAEAFNAALLTALTVEGLHKEDRGAGKHEITCPWVHEHTGEADNGTAIFEAGYIDPSTGEVYMLGGFKCHHGHGEDVHLKMLVRWLVAKGHPIPMLVPGRLDPADEFANVPVPVSDDELLDLPMVRPPPVTKPNVVIGRYEPSDTANAYRLATIADGRLRWHVDTGKWVYFDGARWNHDKNGVGFGLLCAAVGTYVANLADEAGRYGRAIEAKELVKWALASRMSARLRAMAEHVKEIEHISIRTRDLDNDPLLLGVANGVVDLRTGAILPADKALMVMANTHVNFDPKAEAPDWEPFLRSVLAHADGSEDHELFRYVRLFLGYCITGLRTHELFTILHGSGTNGKSTLLSVLERVTGDYGRRVRPEMFEGVRNKSSSGSATPEIAQLPGARVVAASETGEGSRLNMELVKQMTGDDLSARHLYREEFQFTPTFKMLFSTNHLPVVTGTDNATWRRLHPIPFDRRWRLPTDGPGVNAGYPEADLGLRYRLLTQLPGIQAWLIAAARDYLATGETFGHVPDRVTAAQTQYRANSDILGTWILDRCEVGADYTAAGLYTDYRRWCEEMGLRTVSAFTWGRSMQERFGPGVKRGGIVYSKGIRLREYSTDEPQN